MSIDIGIVGPAKSGRTTLFNALTRGQAATGKYTQESQEAHIGTARLSDPRLGVLADMFHPKKLTPASASYIDIGASVKSLAKEKGIGGQLLNQLSNVDALINVVRAFIDETVPHPEGKLDIDRDIANMNLELAFSDLALLERRAERIETSLKGAKPPEKLALLREQELVAKIKAALEKDTPLRQMAFSPEEARVLSGYQLLTAKSLLIAINVGEDRLNEIVSLEEKLNAKYAGQKCQVVALCGKLEMELSQLDENEASEMRKEYGIKEAGIDRIVRASYRLLDLITFFTIASGEVRAWPTPKGTEAVKAAGKIHSDMERGFIRAEVVSYNDLTKCGSIAETKKKGLLRLEGKTYIVQDGDIITFLFNV